MTDTAAPLRLPPESDHPFDIGSTEDSLERMRDLYARFGDIYRVYAPGRQSYTYVVNHPDDVRRILITNNRNYTKGVGFDRIKILLGNGIIVSEGEFWKRQRRMIQPTFHRKVVARFGELIAKSNDQLLARWQAAAVAGAPINVTDDMSILTLEVVLRAIFGDDVDTMTREAGENPFAVLTEEPARDLRFAYRFRKLAAMIGKLVDRRREAGEDKFDYVSMLLAARDKETGAAMTTRELTDEITTLIIAGHETTASALNWAWYLLSQNPEVESRLHAELDVAPDEAIPSLQGMEALKFTNQVIQETMRVYPPVWVISRRTIEADTLAGYEVPPGTDVFFSPYFLHRHPQFWQDAEAFQPERFAAAGDAERPKLAYLPFSAGPHHCVGETLAVYEMLMHLYKVARRYRLVFQPDEPVELEAMINLRTRRPLFMKLQPRS
ncbi:MAG: cytochrome P450 [Steroidobacteraceae bacterium]